jgi:RNA polymerase subunit RPABC4/transcription elongation factor Spt4
MGDFGFDQNNGLFTVLLVYGSMVLIAFWLAIIVWTFRDMRARSRDVMAQIVVAVMVAALNVPGLLIYLFLRPRETLTEAYERSLEEEALLQEIEEKPTCPGCRQRVERDWQACPHCHTRLKKACPRCGKMLELAWDLCPYCTTALAVYTSEPTSATGASFGLAPTASLPPSDSSPRAGRAARRRSSGTTEPPAARSDSLQFVDGDDT